ncbi:hypothetical protein WICPIJ_008866 [Wickerhamomyces pijperi]|uniref:glucan endo-1,3-beta-D-glucosidase n=1 Tax=Wickerhamomyces pijperi TaxID=599730 RepID=A0A9P8PVQ4_WICPI|nr:hypothetical protein WICPIJ_008866 [Wickerhamomyces pijperi]
MPTPQEMWTHNKSTTASSQHLTSNQTFGINNLISKFSKMSTQEQQQPLAAEQQDVHATDIFSNSISTDAPLSEFARTTHPVSIPSTVVTESKPIGTNKFYGNFLLGTQTLPTWTHPYSIWFSLDSGYEGLAVEQALASSRVFGPDGTTPPEYFFSPTGIKQLVLGSSDFDSSTTVGLQNVKHMSTDVLVKSSSAGYILAPTVQGQGFITAIYYNLIPKITSAVGFTSITGDTSPRSGINKYKIVLADGRTWLLYITIPSGQSLSVALKDGNTIVTSNSVNGAVFQICADDNSSVFDQAAGAYPTRANLTGSVSDSTGTYSINYSVAGGSNSGTTVMYALPHHVDSFTSDMSSQKTSVTMATTTKGVATAYLTNAFNFSLTVPSFISFAPYSAISGASVNYSSSVLSSIKTAATSEVQDDVYSDSNVDSMYTSGKILAKYAWILYVTHYVLGDDSLTNILLPKVKASIERFANNTQQVPLSYDQTWKGVLSTADSSGDYGNSYYNDHHFHYGYHIIAAAITCYVDSALGGSWINTVKPWVQDLVRDIATPSDDDTYFPAFRSFDWYNGHSWAKGLFVSGDGKDQESSSEDYNAWYGVRLWAQVIGDTSLEQRSLLQLGIEQHSLNHYYLYADSNTTEPSNFIANKVAGILFENKIDHTTYFGTELQYIQMIHAIPITSFSSFIRSPTFVSEEWSQKLSAIADSVTDGWKGIMYLNLALTDPTTSYNFFNSSSFSNAYLDNGQSKTWSLTYSGAFASGV